MDQRFEELERRLEIAEQRAAGAERQVRSLRLAGVAVLVGVTALAVVRPGISQEKGKAASSKAIKVTKVTAPFQVVDQSGKLIMMVESGKPGPYLHLFDSAGKPAVALANGDKGGGKVDVFDRTGKAVFTKP